MHAGSSSADWGGCSIPTPTPDPVSRASNPNPNPNSNPNPNPRPRLQSLALAGVVKVTIAKTGTLANFKAGQYIFIMVPDISVFQWHPFR